jgi:hypothetical protein
VRLTAIAKVSRRQRGAVELRNPYSKWCVATWRLAQILADTAALFIEHSSEL